MRLPKLLFIITIITLLAIIYVQQQVSLLRLSYEIKDKEEFLEELLDKNRILRYNVFVLESPASLEKRLLTKDIIFKMPDTWQMVNLPEDKLKNNLARPGAKKVLLGTFFNLNSPQAEAKDN